MARRTDISNAGQIERSDDLERLVKDKREAKRANKQKGKRRNRHYVKTLMRHFTQGQNETLDE